MRKKSNKIVRSFALSEKISTVHNSTTADRTFRSLALIIACFTFMLYLPTLKNEFVNWDDYQYILDNLHIRSLNGTFFRWAFTDTSIAMYWHPLTWISHAIDYALWGRKAFGHHLTSILLHAINSAFAVCLTYRLLEMVNIVRKDATSPSPPIERHSLLVISGTVGLLFGIHPLHVESVAWVAMRKDPLYALFFMLSIIFYISYRRHRDELKNPSTLYNSKRYYASLLFFIAALSCKPMAVTLPVVLLLLDCYPLNRLTNSKGFVFLIIEKIPFIAASIIVTAGTIISQKSGDILGLAESYPLSTRIPAAFCALANYIGRTVIPTDLLPLYPYPLELTLTSPPFLLAAVLITIITCFCILMLRRQPFWLTAWLFYVITVAPTLGINQVGANRYIYLPALGFFVILGIFFASLWSEASRRNIRAQRLVAGAGVLILIVLSALTLKQIGIWSNSMSLWDYVIKNGSPNPSAFNSRGHVYKNAGAFGNAIDDYSRAITIKPSWATYYVNRGAAYGEKGEFDNALADLNKAAMLKPDNHMIFNNRGTVLYRKGESDKALEDFNKAIALNPNGHLAYNNRGMLFRSRGMAEMAKNDFGKAITNSPEYVDAYYNRATLNIEKGDTERALEDLNRVISINPALSDVYVDRGDLYTKIGNTNHAANDYRKACDMGNGAACSKISPK